MEMLFWIIIGAIIGVVAAQRRGFGSVSGFIIGALLGPLALLMFFASSGRRRCPKCAEWVQKKAALCPHCRSEIA